MDSNPFNNDNNEENNENFNNTNGTEDKQGNIIDELINEINNSINIKNLNKNNKEETNNNNFDIPNEFKNKFETMIANDNINQNLEDEINKKDEENDYPNEFENLTNEKYNEKKNIININKINNNEDKNSNNNNYEEDKPDDDFINPFKDFNYNGSKPYEDNNNYNAFSQKNNEQNIEQYNNTNNNINNNINNITNNNASNNTNNNNINANDDNDFSNPFLDFNNNNNNNNYNNNDNNNNNDINNNNDDDFSNPFKDDFGSHENNNNNLNNNNFELRQNQNNNQNNYNMYSIPNKQDNTYNTQYNINFNNNNFNNNNFNNNNYYRPNNLNNNNNYYHPKNLNNNSNDNFNNNNYYHPQNLNNNNNGNFNNNNNYYHNNNNDINNNYENNQDNQDNNNNTEQKNNNDIPHIKKIEIKNEKSSEDYKKIEAIIKKCESLYNTAKTNYVNYFVRESIATLKKIVKTLSSVKQTITTQKSELSFFLPKIEMLENLSSSTLNDFLLNFYELINTKYNSINLPITNSKEILNEVCSKFILTNPFIAFDDIFDKSNMIDIFCQVMKGANARNSKCILLYGGRGVGKTLLVHGYARKTGGSVIQLEGTDFLKIPFFAAEFGKVCVKNTSFNKPLYVYIKNIDKMLPCLNQLNFIYDKIASSFKLNIYFIASTSLELRFFPKNLYTKFQYYLEIKNVAQNNKPEYFRFICDKIGIKLNINLIEFNDFVNNYLGSFSNKKIYELIKLAINIKKERAMQNEDQNWIYKEGLNLIDLKNAISNISPYL